MLAEKQILVFAATGAIGQVAARKFAQEGAQVWLSGRNRSQLEALTNAITDAGGKATSHVVDATNTEAINAYVEQVAAAAGRIDGVFNAIGRRPSELGFPESSVSTPFEHFMRPVEIILGSTFLTSRAVAGVMLQQGHGSIVTLCSGLSAVAVPFMAGVSAANAGITGLTRALAAEFGLKGIRVNGVRAGAMPETGSIRETGEEFAKLGLPSRLGTSLLGRPISVAETAATAAFLLSDAASGMTGQIVTVSAGGILGA